MDNYKLVPDYSIDLDELKVKLTDSLSESNIDSELVVAYQDKIDSVNSVDELKSVVNKYNSQVDKLVNNPGSVYSPKDDSVSSPNDVANNVSELQKKLKETEDELAKAKKDKDDAKAKELEDKKAQIKEDQDKNNELALSMVGKAINGMADTTKGLISGNPDQMVDAILGVFTGIADFLTSDVSTYVKQAKDIRERKKEIKESESKSDKSDKPKIDKDKDDTEAALKALSESVSESKKKLSKFTQTSQIKGEDIKALPKFEDVGKITDWDSAYKYGYAKLQQIFGDRFDKNKADEALKGLKDKYPDNPMAVIGAFKYHHHKSEDSRVLNSKVTEIANKFLRKLNVNNWKDVFLKMASEFGAKLTIPEDISGLHDYMSFAESDNSIPDELFNAMEYLCNCQGSNVNINNRAECDREKVDPNLLKLAKTDGVIQKKPNGSWGIISLQKGEWWSANYQSYESAQAALKAYHARKRGSRCTNSTYTVRPDSRNELKRLIEDTIKKEGPNCDLNFIDTSWILDMSDLFEGSQFNGTINKWDVSNVKDMHNMFLGSQFSGDISRWDVSNVRYMSYMFAYSKFNSDLSKWNVSEVRNMSGMFQASKFNRDISNWKVSKIANTYEMFDGSPLESNPPKWYRGANSRKYNSTYTVQPKDKQELRKIIRDTISKKGLKCDLNFIDTSLIVNMDYLFRDSKFNGKIDKWDTSKVETMRGMFHNSEFRGVISDWDVHNVMDMSYMFSDSLFRGNLSGWNVSNVKNMENMFRNTPLESNPPKWYKS